MDTVEVRSELKIALSSLSIGALAAPIFHIASSIVAPQGFANMRGDLAWLVPPILVVTWLWSVGYTLIFGGMAWPLLHWRNWDGFATYVVAALISAVCLSLASSGDLPPWDLPVMAALNALAVRLTELRLRARWDAKPESSTEH